MVETNRWPEERPFTGAGFARVDTPVSCVLTRFRLRSAWSLLHFYLAFRRIRREASSLGGLLHSALLVEDLHTCYTFSLWANEEAIVDFGTRVKSHITAANSSFSHVHYHVGGRPEIWSAQFRLWGVSCHNMMWKELDLESHLAGEWQNRQRVAEMGTPMAEENL